MTWIADQERLERVEAALRGARHPPLFPETVDLSLLVRELESWLADERQWRHAYTPSWKSLVRDVRRSVIAYPPSVLASAGGGDGLRDELDLCAREIAEKELPREELLRRRLGSICTRLREGLTSPGARAAAWDDVISRSGSAQEAKSASKRLFSLTAWAGLDTRALLEAIEFSLQGQGQLPLAPASHRLRRAGERVVEAPRTATIAVWLRLLFAPLRAGTLSVGPLVTLYQADWLASRFDQPDAGAPQDIVQDDGILRQFCRVDEVLASTQPTVAKHVETPTALARIEVTDATTQDAVARARRTAATLGALGTLYGAEPTLWQVDHSYVTFRDGRRAAATSAAAIVESPTITERIGVSRDPTSGLLRHNAERLGRHLPVEGGRMGEIAELLLWLRDARSSPPPSRLVLCDRAIETVSGWAGVASPRRLVERHLIPLWAHRQMLGEVRAIAIELFYNDPRRVFPKDDDRHQCWADLVTDSALRLREVAEAGDYSALSALISHMAMLGAGLPADHPQHDRVEQIDRRLRTPKAAQRWFSELVELGNANEERRSRTRNALMHGGPLAEATAEVLIPFAQYMADEAIARTLNAFLDGEDAPAAFIKLEDKLVLMRRRLSMNGPVHEALVWD
jgi:hypothetical protein